ncbi:cytochrome c oxidase subunit II [Marilutibacter alkalisoli]|uniref:cytochrome-c oxidase n=1 Tax=Marilutibacter alkalisoli TaxID=2591633 RepID=A0A514BUT1_9GAMM|nr:cytochrome c oxidase subunit II [Lysobacter alkalisoli]QDH71126.1 cytochrome c oxidase subunit II [Lysobacter alkalisoli]
MLLSACAGPQSALDPAGPAASAIATTWWLMFGTATAVWTIVMGLLLLAMRRGRGMAPVAGRKLIVIGGVLVPTVLLAALLVYGTRTSDRVTGRGSDVDLVVRVTARQWQWQFDYLDGDGATIASTFDRLVLPSGQMVEFRVGSRDVIHSFWIPRLGGKMDAIPGRENVIRLRADQPGPMRGQCAEFCGLDHATMAFDVVVLDPDELPAWLRANAGVAADGNAQ